ncbi:TonB-dependent receptor [Amphiplicatus metriothermophilus]|uniref:TonB-dependent receptor n=1 Tax=Amphiplicatus metriothermophilus TaxID=1519374 RepID=A0A239PWA3_9PROT|nr:TonB-dependent receptor [Amphiplicatus metriothermophilus]MBB5519659.1 TonB-dependent receptor [Amphiplicatus metriothermophilus]SNT74222.1 TonB-dependent receptor [Amphiplicatus metriothermophilus]
MRLRTRKSSVNRALKNGASVLALGAFAIGAQICPPGAAWAQDGASEGEEETGDTIVVTGIRRSIESATERKRTAEEVIDALTAVDIGALPDRSVAEALQRIPGIQLQRTNENRDPARLSSEGGGVFVRGLRWVRTETNGRDIFSASNGRSLSFEDVSADLLAGVDVYKNPSAEQIEGGIGGIVNLRTRKPFDQDGRLVAGTIDYNYADLLSKGFVSGSAIVSDRWETGAGELGFLFSASIADIGNRTDAIQLGRFELRDDGNLYPTGLGFRRIDWEQDRKAFSGAVQWAPNEDLLFTFEALYATASPFDVERAVLVNGASTGDLLPSDVVNGQFDDDGVLIAGEIPGASLTYDTRIGDRKSKTGDYSFNFRYAPGSRWTISGDFQYVDSSAEVLSMTAFTQLGVAPFATGARPTVTFDTDGDDPFISISDLALQADKSAYWWAAAMDHIQDNDARSYAGRLDLEYDLDTDGFLRSFRFGGRITDKRAITRQSGFNWSLLSQQFWGSGGGGPVFLDEPGGTDLAPAGPNPGLPDQVELFFFENFFRGDLATPGVGWFPKAELLTDTQHAFSFLESTLTSGWGWVPLTEEAYETLDPRGDNVSAGINDQREDTYAGYVVARFADEGDLFGLPFDGGVGVRVVHTKTTGTGRGSAGGLGEACATNPSDDCARAAAFIDAFNAEFGEYQEFTNSYTKALPSLNIRFELSDELQLRLAASRGMVRPSFSQIRAYENLSFAFEDNMFDPDAEFTGQAGAPQLKPTMSTNLDASLEWYFANGSLAFAAFYKDISDYVVIQRAPETFTFGGETFTFEVLRQTNAEEGTLKGFEVQYQQFYDFLPGPLSGLGVQANFTFIDNDGGANEALNPFEPAQEAGASDASLPIEGISRTSYNITGLYQKYGIEGRLAYNWRERYLLTTSAANINRPVFWEDYGQLDGSIFYSINEHAKIGVQATNILNARTFLQVGDETLSPRYSWTDTDRRIAVIARFKL